MMPPFLSTILRSLARHGLTVLAGVLLAKGWLAQDQVNAAGDMLGDYAGALGLGLVALGWSYVEKRWAHTYIERVQAALGAPKTGRVADLIPAIIAFGESLSKRGS
jgi:hypothetical protein